MAARKIAKKVSTPRSRSAAKPSATLKAKPVAKLPRIIGAGWAALAPATPPRTVGAGWAALAPSQAPRTVGAGWAALAPATLPRTVGAGWAALAPEKPAATPKAKSRREAGLIARLEAEIARLASELEAERQKTATAKAEKRQVQREAKKREAERLESERLQKAKEKAKKQKEKRKAEQLEAEKRETETDFVEPKRKPKAKAKPDYFRDDRGMFVSEANFILIQKRKAEDAELLKLEKAERIRRKREYSVEIEKYRKMQHLFERIGKAVRNSTQGVSADVTSAVMGAAVDGMIEISNFFNSSDDIEIRQQFALDVLSRALDAALKILRRKSAGKGLLFRLTLVPTDNVLLQYKREEDFMSTAWNRCFAPQELESMYAKSKNLAQQIIDNEWDITKIQLKFRYDHEVATQMDAAERKAAKQRRTSSPAPATSSGRTVGAGWAALSKAVKSKKK